MAKKMKKPVKSPRLLRTHSHVFLLNDLENRALNRYIKKYSIKNKAKLIREMLMIAIIQKLEEDSPTLFD
jgi:hypothetical protein